MADEIANAQVAQPGGDTIFGKIIRKEIPAKILIEDDTGPEFFLLRSQHPLFSVIVNNHICESSTVEEDGSVWNHSMLPVSLSRIGCI
uniref:Uncharacterized protein n=1 Tax=Oncorhynchus tshawytscha TaxID=74940 RepID=A0A8C8CQS9_ONCTS